MNPANNPTEFSVERIIDAFEALSPQRVKLLGDIYAGQARFKDPFNDVQGLTAIQQIFRFRNFQRDVDQAICGGSHLVLNELGQITLHRDYWDAAEELYEKLPMVGGLMRWLKKRANS